MEQNSEIHAGHSHVHGANCGHKAVKHDGHLDYLHEGHLHHPASTGVVEEHSIAVSQANPATCTAGNPSPGHSKDHVHGPGCGDEAIKHGDHTDYLVGNRLHHQHGDHCDSHGQVDLA